MKRALVVVLNVLAGVLVAVPPALLVHAPAAVAATAGPVLYAATGRSTASNLYILNPATGAVVSTVGSIGFAVTGLAVDPTTGILYGATSNKSPGCAACILTIDRTTGAGTVVGPENLFDAFGDSQGLADITFTSRGQLYGWAEPDSDQLATVNKATGAATLIGSSPESTAGSGISANGADVLYFTGEGNEGDLHTVSRTTSAFTSAVTMNGTTGDEINALSFACDRTTLYGNTSSAQLITIDTSTGVITQLGATPNQTDAIAWFCGIVAPTPTRTITGDLTGPVTVASGESVLITNARVVGPVTVLPGGALSVVNSQISRGVTVDNPTYLSICGSSLSGPAPAQALGVTNAAVPIRIGDPASGCAGNRIAGDVNLTSNQAVTFGANVTSNNVTVTHNGPGATVVKANTVTGALNCSGNNPPATNAGQPNTAGSIIGPCATGV